MKKNSKTGLLQNKLFQSSLIVFVLLVGSGLFLSLGTGLFANGLINGAMINGENGSVYSGTIVLSDDFKFQGELFDFFAEGNVMNVSDNEYAIRGWGEYVSDEALYSVVFPGDTSHGHNVWCDIVATACGSRRFWVLTLQNGTTMSAQVHSRISNVNISVLGGANSGPTYEGKWYPILTGNMVPTDLPNEGELCISAGWYEVPVYSGLAKVWVRAERPAVPGLPAVDEPFPISYASVSYKCRQAN